MVPWVLWLRYGFADSMVAGYGVLVSMVFVWFYGFMVAGHGAVDSVDTVWFCEFVVVGYNVENTMI